MIEDGPTTTHGGMAFGAGWLAAQEAGAAKIIDPRPYAVGSIKTTFAENPHLKDVLPAMGYSEEQISELEETANKAECDVIVSGTPIDITHLLKTNKPIIHIKYNLEEIGEPNLETVLKDF